jgi:hypothetical protein
MPESGITNFKHVLDIFLEVNNHNNNKGAPVRGMEIGGKSFGDLITLQL